MRRIIEFTLTQLSGNEVKTSSSGKDALNVLKSERFDVVIIDRVMPDMDGLETARQIITSSSRPRAVFVMSSNFSPDEIAKCTEIGVDGILEKPIKPKEFEVLWEQTKAKRPLD